MATSLFRSGLSSLSRCSLPRCLTTLTQRQFIQRDDVAVRVSHIKCNKRLISTKQAVKMDKNLLSKLRKKTGFGFSKCREALVTNENDYSAAEAWLHEQAEREGWDKATKLQGRAVSEGLVGLIIHDDDIKLAAMVEINCETDFVARNNHFVDLVSMVTHSALTHRKAIIERNQKLNTFTDRSVHLREVILTHDLGELKSTEGIVEESVAMTIGKLGENIKLGRAITMTTESNNTIGSYVHGPFVKNINKCSLGKFGAIVAIKPLHEISDDKMALLSSKLAQHIVGMNPKTISSDGSPSSSRADVSEVLLEQEYLLGDAVTVGQFVEKEGVEIVDFVRYECGEK